jgi:hypothetical protein
MYFTYGSVVFAYSLLPPEGMIPRFAQTYVYDPKQDESEEANIRLELMRLHLKMEAMGDKLLVLLSKLQRWLQRSNLYILNFIQVCEILTEQVEKMQLVIRTRRIKESYNHAGVYNVHTK